MFEPSKLVQVMKEIDNYMICGVTLENNILFSVGCFDIYSKGITLILDIAAKRTGILLTRN